MANAFRLAQRVHIARVGKTTTLLDDVGQFVSHQPGSGQDFQSVEVGLRNISCPEVKALA
jgi:hypothetical protein